MEQVVIWVACVGLREAQISCQGHPNGEKFGGQGHQDKVKFNLIVEDTPQKIKISFNL